ncbi:MAG: hypothetical protein JRN52_10320 [Nitrososphaerota archaeon]|nr:hypothetical protein [Nitrososphaerota archaeon]
MKRISDLSDILPLLACSGDRSDSEVKHARKQIVEKGWVREILNEQDPKGFCISDKILYQPK